MRIYIYISVLALVNMLIFAGDQNIILSKLDKEIAKKNPDVNFIYLDSELKSILSKMENEHSNSLNKSLQELCEFSKDSSANLNIANSETLFNLLIDFLKNNNPDDHLKNSIEQYISTATKAGPKYFKYGMLAPFGNIGTVNANTINTTNLVSNNLTVDNNLNVSGTATFNNLIIDGSSPSNFNSSVTFNDQIYIPNMTAVNDDVPALNNYNSVYLNTTTGQLVQNTSVPIGDGDVHGPNSAHDAQVAVYSEESGKIIKTTLVTIDTNGNTQIPGTLNVSGNATLDGLDIIGDATFHGDNTIFNVNVNIGNNLNVTGATTLNTLNINGAATLLSSLNVSGNAQVRSLSVIGSTTIGVDLTLTGIQTQENNLVTINNGLLGKSNYSTSANRIALSANDVILTDIFNNNYALGGNNLTTIKDHCYYNVAIGANALNRVDRDNNGANVAIGAFALNSENESNLGENTAIGYSALFSPSTTSISNTIAIGAYAGSQNHNCTGNIYINHLGVNFESNTIRIGTQGERYYQQNECYIAGINGQSVDQNTSVLVGTDGKLGTAVSSSRRYKENIKKINSNLVNKLDLLNPVEFNYKNQSVNDIQYGLIAEEVLDIAEFKKFVIFKDNQVESIRYQNLPILLLARLQQLIKEDVKKEERIAKLEKVIQNLSENSK